MSIVKYINAPWTITGNDVIITGNLTVSGTQTALETINTTTTNKLLTLNDGETGTGVGPAATGQSGFKVDRGLASNVALVWNEPTQSWQIQLPAGNFANILYATGPANSVLNAVINDPAPVLGGNLNTNQYTISSNVGNINFLGNLQIDNTNTVPSTVVTNATLLYAATPGAGTSGLYVLNGQAANQELITKTRAVGFSILL